MKNLISILTAALVFAGVVACGGSNANEQGDAPDVSLLSPKMKIAEPFSGQKTNLNTSAFPDLKFPAMLEEPMTYKISDEEIAQFLENSYGGPEQILGDTCYAISFLTADYQEVTIAFKVNCREKTATLYVNPASLLLLQPVQLWREAEWRRHLDSVPVAEASDQQ